MPAIQVAAAPEEALAASSTLTIMVMDENGKTATLASWSFDSSINSLTDENGDEVKVQNDALDEEEAILRDFTDPETLKALFFDPNYLSMDIVDYSSYYKYLRNPSEPESDEEDTPEETLLGTGLCYTAASPNKSGTATQGYYVVKQGVLVSDLYKIAGSLLSDKYGVDITGAGMNAFVAGPVGTSTNYTNLAKFTYDQWSDYGNQSVCPSWYGTGEVGDYYSIPAVWSFNSGYSNTWTSRGNFVSCCKNQVTQYKCNLVWGQNFNSDNYANSADSNFDGGYYSGGGRNVICFFLPEGTYLPEESDISCESVELSQTTLNLTLGGSSKLTAKVTPSDTADSLSWSSSNESVATVDSSGKVTAVAAGTATITAKCGDYSATCTVTVTKALSSISVTSFQLYFGAGEAPSTGNTKVTATYSDNSTATVTSVATLTLEGNTLTASYCGKTATCAVTQLSVAAPSQDSDGVYQIANGEQLLWFADLVNNRGTTDAIAKLTADVDTTTITDSSGNSVTYVPIGTTGSNIYKGTFDGDSHSVTLGLSRTSDKYRGIFGLVGAATISNVTSTGSVSGYNFVGGIVGQIEGAATLTNCINSANVTASYQDCGGVVGRITSSGVKISNCSNTGTITGGSGGYTGGILGRAASSFTMTNCTNTGKIVGGLGNNVGGIVGFSNSASTITNCTNANTVSGAGTLGGIIGSSTSCTITSCSNSSSVTGTGSVIGGIAGSMSSGEVSSCSNSGAVSGTNNVGGLVGSQTDGTVGNSVNEATVTISGTTASANAGGIVANAGSGAVISGCANKGAVTKDMTSGSASSGVGGVVGYAVTSGNSITIENCYNSAAVKSAYCVGGIVGYATGSTSATVAVSNSYNAGTITDCASGSNGSYAGSVLGNGLNSYVSFTNCYYLTGTATNAEGTSSKTGTFSATIKTSDELKDTAMPTSLGDAWAADSGAVKVNSGYPILSWQKGSDSEEYIVQVRSGLQSNNGTSVANVSGGGLYSANAKATLKAPSVSGMTFLGWYNYIDGSLSNKIEDAGATYTFDVTGDASYIALYAPASSSETVAISAAVDDNCSAMGTASVSAMSGSATIGSQVTFTATEKSGYKFLYWTNSAGRIVSTSASYDTTALKATSYTAVFAESDNSDVLVNFLDGSSGAFIRAQRYTSTQAEEIVKAPAPSKSGYSFVCWSDASGNELSESAVAAMIKAAASAGGVVTVYANYQASASTYTATLFLVNESGTQLGESITSSGHVAGTPVQFNANSTYTTSTGTKLYFAGFYSSNTSFTDATLLSLSTSYTASFDSSDDAIVYAKYVGTESTTEYASITLAEPKATYTNVEKLTFSMSWSLPDGCTLVKAGFNRGLTSDLGSTSLTTLTGNSGMFTINVNMSSYKDSPYYVQAFVTYTYGDSETQYTIYSGDAAGTTSVAVGNNGTAAVCVSSSYNTLSGASSSN